MPTVYKIMTEAEWDQTRREGAFQGAPVDLADGYIHLSAPDQVAETAAKHFAGRTGLMLIAVETTPLGEALRWEPSRGGALFPHLYGPLPLSAVIAAHPLPLGKNGTHQFP